MKTTAVPALLAAWLAAGGVMAGIAPPIHALAPSTVPAGEAEVRAGLDYSYHEWGMFQSSDTGRELVRLPDLTLTLGMSDKVELVFNFPWLWLKQGDGSYAGGPGDLKIAGIYNLTKETDTLPAFALVIATKLPDAHYKKGFGTDQTDFWAGGACSKTFDNLRVLANASLGILEDPTGDEPNQDDVLVYDIGVIYSMSGSIDIGCGLDGIANSRMGNDRMFTRGGIAFRTQIGTFDLSVGTGLNHESGDLHIAAGFSTALGAWNK